MAKLYAIREMFNTLQGEGARAGHRSVFIRFAGCNMWNGEPEDRDKGAGACASWCDTDFASWKSLKMSAAEIADEAQSLWRNRDDERWVVLTGGEPALSVDRELLDELRKWGFKIAVETNGSVANVDVSLCDWVTVSPKLPKDPTQPLKLEIDGAHELKVVIATGDGWSDDMLAKVQQMGKWKRLYVQPRDAVQTDIVDASILKGNVNVDTHISRAMAAEQHSNVERCVRWVYAHPEWNLSLQTHKYLGLA